MKTTPDLSIFSPKFQAILTPLQEENQLLKMESQEWKQKYHHLLEQLRLSQQRQFSRSSEANILQGELVFDEAEAVEATELPQEDNPIKKLFYLTTGKRDKPNGQKNYSKTLKGISRRTVIKDITGLMANPILFI